MADGVEGRDRARRWTIEPSFRDTKDRRFGMGLSSNRIVEPTRRDRLLLVSAFATARLSLLGTVGERLEMDRLLKSNTTKALTHSLFRQGCMPTTSSPTCQIIGWRPPGAGDGENRIFLLTF